MNRQGHLKVNQVMGLEGGVQKQDGGMVLVIAITKRILF